jgi:hypothetical protein
VAYDEVTAQLVRENRHLRDALEAILRQPQETMSDGKALAAMVRIARAALKAKDVSGVKASPAGQPFFTAKDIALATMTPEQESAAQQGWCMKCAMPSLSEKHREGGMRWLQCSRCTTVYALGVPVVQAPSMVEQIRASTEYVSWFPIRPAVRPCDLPGGCNGRNCLGCGETPAGVTAVDGKTNDQHTPKKK